ncbi:MAG TPA: alpha/beta hydrolase-fold protein [Streptosporangiaceae bacterium]|jgi:S-formylglutathione hydrolase FrmB|nr:alpha/beta hydrolase-fold protein [Streptosporangiaceae bacterium]
MAAGRDGRGSRSLDRLAVLAVFGLLMVMPSGVTRLASSDARETGSARGTVRVLEVRGPTDRWDHPVWVWRPPGPDSAMIPVVYFLHGYPGKASDCFSHGLAEVLNLRLEEGYPPFVVACPDGNGERHSDTEWANSADGGEQVENRLLDAVIPTVEGARRRDAAHRAITGFSMGGYGAMNIAQQQPGTFGQVVSIAGYFNVNDLSDMFGDLPAVVAANGPDAHAWRARGMHILLDEDASDPEPLIRGQAKAFARLLAGYHIPATVRIQPGSHGWGYAESALTGSFSFLDDGWQQAAEREAAWRRAKT